MNHEQGLIIPLQSIRNQKWIAQIVPIDFSITERNMIISQMNESFEMPLE